MLTHRKSYTKEYDIWRRLKRDCNCKTVKSYEYMGAKGFYLCERWNDFSEFYKDMGDCPEECTGISIKDEEEKELSRENCYWSRSNRGRKKSTDKTIRRKRRRSALKNRHMICICIERDTFDLIRKQSHRQSLERGYTVSTNDLIREALNKHFPVPTQVDMFGDSLNE